MSDVPMFQFLGASKIVLFVITVLALVGIIFAIRGFWGRSRSARRFAILSAALVLPIGLLCGVVVLMRGFQAVARLGPAVTPRDWAYVWGSSLGPVFAGLLSAVLIATVAGIGWAREREITGAEPPPRKPAA